MKKYILDASVIVGALLNENLKAREVMKRKVNFFAPVLLTTEVANALRFKLPIASEAQSLYQDFAAFPITLSALNQEQMIMVIKLAYENKSAIYDVYYHYLAISLGGVLLTSDREYYLKAKKLGFIELI